jgi:hypothetical protein
MTEPIATSWLLHSIKILLGDESIRHYIIAHYFPELKYKLKKHIRTFDAFVPKGTTRNDKYDKITKYLESIENLQKDIVVFTATNVQQNDEDDETHFQSFIVDNEKKQVYVIDPALDKKKPNFIGIYYPEITIELIKPHFEEKGYNVKFIQLSRPAQTETDDVFCQSWSLIILLEMINDNNYEKNEEYKIPYRKGDKYGILLEFYKGIFVEMPELIDNLREEYVGTINELSLRKNEKNELLRHDPYRLLQSMTKEDMK